MKLSKNIKFDNTGENMDILSTLQVRSLIGKALEGHKNMYVLYSSNSQYLHREPF